MRHKGSPSRRKINLEKVRASLATPCPNCNYQIPPSELLHIDFTQIRCPKCGINFDANRTTRDDFSQEVKRTLAIRVNYFCSNPECHAQTSGPQDDPTKVVNIGVAAHITAASAGGPRYNAALSTRERCHPENGIWLCQNCAKLIDSDISRFCETLLRAWKTVAEDRSRNSLGKTAPESVVAEKPLPRLELYLELVGIEKDNFSLTPVRAFELGLTNAPGCGTAKFPGVRYRPKCGLVVNQFGIDGNCGFGLPRRSSDNEWEVFRGGADHVIHPGETLKITKLLQRGADAGSQRFFSAINFQCEISAEGVPMVRAERSIPEGSFTCRC